MISSNMNRVRRSVHEWERESERENDSKGESSGTVLFFRSHFYSHTNSWYLLESSSNSKYRPYHMQQGNMWMWMRMCVCACCVRGFISFHLKIWRCLTSSFDDGVLYYINALNRNLLPDTYLYRMPYDFWPEKPKRWYTHRERKREHMFIEREKKRRA